jgi:hypothetical protein
MKMTEQPASHKTPSLNDAPDPILWKDRKRFLGLPLSFTRYQVDQTRLYTKIGFFRTITDEVLLYRILDIKLTRTLGQKLFGVGTIMLFTADQSENQIKLKNIKKSDNVRRFLSEMVEEERNKRRIIGRELYGVEMPGMVDMDGDGKPD